MDAPESMPAFVILHNVHVNGQASIESSCTMFLFDIQLQSVLTRAQHVGRQRRGIQEAQVGSVGRANRAAEPTRAGCEAQWAPTRSPPTRPSTSSRMYVNAFAVHNPT